MHHAHARPLRPEVVAVLQSSGLGASLLSWIRTPFTPSTPSTHDANHRAQARVPLGGVLHARSGRHTAFRARARSTPLP
jgi:hypothetical protein